jgi:integrase
MAAVVTGGSGLHGHRVDWLRGRLTVVDVMTRQGLRQWPKSKKSHRTVPVPPPAMEGMSVLMAGRPRNTLVFTAFEGGAVTDEHFRDRIWYPAVEAAGIRRFPPRIMRHTAASWLVQDGVRCTRFRRSSATRTMPRRSGTRTLRRMLTTG